jgi:uncharacterized RDD family membrane protein YckC
VLGSSDIKIMQWYYANNDQRLGPISEAEFNKLVADGAIVATTLVWNQTMTNWTPYAQVAPAAASSVAAPAPAPDTEVCAVSGKRYPKREMIQFEGKWISAEHRDQFFQRQREGLSAMPNEMLYGGFWIRFVAKLIDGIILYVLNIPVSLLLGYGFMSGPQLDSANPNFGAFFGAMIMMQLIYVVIAIGYSWFFISRYQATPGKMALGLKVVRADGSHLSTGRIIGRYFAEMVSGITLSIGYIIAAFDEPQKRSLHDRICDTRVIKK